MTDVIPGSLHQVVALGVGYPLLAPVAAALAVLAIAALVLGVGDGRQGWDWWWVIPAGLLFARRLQARFAPVPSRAGAGVVRRFIVP